MPVTGLQAVVRMIEKAKNKHIQNLERGLTKGGLWLQRESQKIVPVDTGVLRASAFTRTEAAGSQIIVTVGYTAAYAVYVHEIGPIWVVTHGAEFNHKHAKQIQRGTEHSRGSKQQWKFLETPARRRDELLEVIHKEMK